jgi:ribosomal protein L13E
MRSAGCSTRRAALFPVNWATRRRSKWKRIVMTSRSESHHLDNTPNTRTNVTHRLDTRITVRCTHGGSAWRKGRGLSACEC